MALSDVIITINTIDNTSLSMSYTFQNIPEHIEFVRGATTGNLSAGAEGVAADAVVIGLLALQAKYPVGSPDVNIPLATLRGYTSRDAPDDQTVNWGLVYKYESPAWNSTVATLESSSHPQVYDTDQSFNQSSGKFETTQIGNYQPNWLDINAPQPSPVVYESPPQTGFAPRSAAARVWRYTLTIYDLAAANALDKTSLAYDQCLNSTPFKGLTTGSAAQNLNCDVGTCMMLGFYLKVDPYEATALATLEVGYRPETWAEWPAHKNLQGAVSGNVWRASASGNRPANGIVQAYMQSFADLNAFLSQLTGKSPSPFPTGN